MLHPVRDGTLYKMKELVEFHIANGTDAIIVCGTTGEASYRNQPHHSP